MNSKKVYAEWEVPTIINGYTHYFPHCTNCNYVPHDGDVSSLATCPECGADMVGAKNEDN